MLQSITSNDFNTFMHTVSQIMDHLKNIIYHCFIRILYTVRIVQCPEKSEGPHKKSEID